MQKGMIYVLFSLTFYSRLLLIGYVMKVTEIAKKTQFRNVILKMILMNSYSYCFIFYILLTKNALQLRLYKIFLVMNIFAVYFLFTYLGVRYNIIFIYQVLIFADILIEMYSVRKFYIEFMRHYAKKVGMSFKTYKNYVIRQKAMLCIFIYILSFLIDIFFDLKNFEIIKVLMIIMLYISFFKGKIHRNLLILTLFIKIVYKTINLLILYQKSSVNNANFLYKALFGNGINCCIMKFKRCAAKDRDIVNLLSDTYEYLLLLFLMYYSIKLK